MFGKRKKDWKMYKKQGNMHYHTLRILPLQTNLLYINEKNSQVTFQHLCLANAKKCIKCIMQNYANDNIDACHLKAKYCMREENF